MKVASFEGEEEDEEYSSFGDGGGDFGLKKVRARVLVRMRVVVFESYLQRPKDVIFEGLSEEGLVMVVVEKGRRR